MTGRFPSIEKSGKAKAELKLGLDFKPEENIRIGIEGNARMDIDAKALNYSFGGSAKLEYLFGGNEEHRRWLDRALEKER